MIWPRAFLSRLLRDEWREIPSAPRDREIEVAMMDGCIIMCAGLSRVTAPAAPRDAEAGRCNRHAEALRAADDAADQLLLIGRATMAERWRSSRLSNPARSAAQAS